MGRQTGCGQSQRGVNAEIGLLKQGPEYQERVGVAKGVEVNCF